MKIKRRIGLAFTTLIILMNSMIIFAKTDSATRNFKCSGINVSGQANVSISTGVGGWNKAKSNGSIQGSDIWMTSSSYYFTKVNLNTAYGTSSYKMYNGKQSNGTSTSGYCMWQATMRIYFNNSQVAAWTVCCS